MEEEEEEEDEEKKKERRKEKNEERKEGRKEGQAYKNTTHQQMKNNLSQHYCNLFSLQSAFDR